MWAALVVGLLFLVGAGYNLLGADPDPIEATGGLLIGAVLVLLFVAIRSHRAQAAKLQHWLVSNTPAINRGGARYGEILITPATVLVRYQVALSFLVVTFKIPTRPYVVDQEPIGPVAAVCMLVSLVFGWWGLPWGPIYTVQAITTNIRGGLRHPVAAVLPVQTAPPLSA